MGFIQEFKEFASKGNVVDLAVGIIIGVAFGKITTSLVEDILNPILSPILGKVDLVNKFINLTPDKAVGVTSLAEAKKAGAAVLAYGNFLNTILQFLITAFVMFLIIKAMNEMKRRQEALLGAKPEALAEPPAQEKLLAEIRDLLKEQNAKAG
jgi:large conductance mechanosensitive channel